MSNFDASKNQTGKVLRKHIAGIRTFKLVRTEPIRSLGEDEARMLPGYRYISDDQSMRLLDTDVGSDRLLSDAEYRMRQVMLATKFTIDHDWYSALEPSVGVVKDDEVTLPYEVMFIRLGYQQMSAIVTQNQETHEITVSNFQGDMYSELIVDDETVALYKQHVLCALVAMELGLTKSEPASLVDMGLATTRTGVRTDVFKVLAIRPSHSSGSHNINTGRKGLRWHLRRSHWKMVKGVRKRIKWYAAGNIELGIIVKDYVLDDLR